jgi:hypothetical protein
MTDDLQRVAMLGGKQGGAARGRHQKASDIGGLTWLATAKGRKDEDEKRVAVSDV